MAGLNELERESRELFDAVDALFQVDVLRVENSEMAYCVTSLPFGVRVARLDSFGEHGGVNLLDYLESLVLVLPQLRVVLLNHHHDFLPFEYSAFWAEYVRWVVAMVESREVGDEERLLHLLSMWFWVHNVHHLSDEKFLLSTAYESSVRVVAMVRALPFTFEQKVHLIRYSEGRLLGYSESSLQGLAVLPMNLLQLWFGYEPTLQSPSHLPAILGTWLTV